VQFSNLLVAGQGIVVSPRLILMALRGTAFQITSLSSMELNVYKQWFKEKEVDIGLIRLAEDQMPFQHFLNILERPVTQRENHDGVHFSKSPWRAKHFQANLSSNDGRV
jgi:hypothetical protein